MGGSSSAPAAPNYKPISNRLRVISDNSLRLAKQNYAFAKQAYRKNSKTVHKATKAFFDTMSDLRTQAKEDRARYEQVFQPMEDSLVAEAKDYATPERMGKEVGRAQAGVAEQFASARSNAEQQLESYGINPSATRYAALDTGMRAAEGASKAAAGEQAIQTVEDTARTLRGQAIDVGKGYPAQALAAYGESTKAGTEAVDANLNNTQVSANARSLPSQYMNAATGALGQWGSLVSNIYDSQIKGYAAESQASSGMGSALGSIFGSLMGMFTGGMAEGGVVRPGGNMAVHPAQQFMDWLMRQDGGGVPASASVSGGANVDDVPTKLTAGEFVISKPAVDWYGQKFFHGLMDKVPGAKSAIPAPGGGGSGGGGKTDNPAGTPMRGMATGGPVTTTPNPDKYVGNVNDPNKPWETNYTPVAHYAAPPADAGMPGGSNVNWHGTSGTGAAEKLTGVKAGAGNQADWTKWVQGGWTDPTTGQLKQTAIPTQQNWRGAEIGWSDYAGTGRAIPDPVQLGKRLANAGATPDQAKEIIQSLINYAIYGQGQSQLRGGVGVDNYGNTGRSGTGGNNGGNTGGNTGGVGGGGTGGGGTTGGTGGVTPGAPVPGTGGTPRPVDPTPVPAGKPYDHPTTQLDNLGTPHVVPAGEVMFNGNPGTTPTIGSVGANPEKADPKVVASGKVYDHATTQVDNLGTKHVVPAGQVLHNGNPGTSPTIGVQGGTGKGVPKPGAGETAFYQPGSLTPTVGTKGGVGPGGQVYQQKKTGTLGQSGNKSKKQALPTPAKAGPNAKGGGTGSGHDKSSPKGQDEKKKTAIPAPKNKAKNTAEEKKVTPKGNKGAGNANANANANAGNNKKKAS
jgi:hypothetical protein